MAESFSCKCPERRKPQIRDRNWVVLQRNCHHSAFAGYNYTPSDYSTVKCRTCRAVGRTKAQYVELLENDLPIERWVW